VFPGVLVLDGLNDYGQRGLPENPQTLSVSTLMNRRAGDDYLDGAGFAMWVRSWDGRCFQGTWGPWGLFNTGSGRFSLCPAGKP